MIRILPIALLLLLLIGCADENAVRDAAVEDLQLVRENGDQILRGNLVNKAERPIRGARVFVDLYDGDTSPGAMPADSASFEVLDIQPGETKNFRHILDTGRELTGARLARVVLF